jgi:hypothetical protein
MASAYCDKLLLQLAAHASGELSGTNDVPPHEPGSSQSHVLRAEAYRTNILPGIRERFWQWFEALHPPIPLSARFADLSVSQAVVFNLFFPFIEDGRVDPRLLEVLGVRGRDYTARFDVAVHHNDSEDATHAAHIDFVMEASSGERVFVDVKLAEAHFGRCEPDAQDFDNLARRYAPELREHVDAKWLAPDAFFANRRVMRNLSCLAGDPRSGAVFIFPRANECLKAEEQTIKQIVSKSLAPRVAIYYLEYLVERALKATAADPRLHEHFLRFRAKYICV